MGIKSLSKIFKNKYDEEIKLSKIENHIIAVDILIYLYKYIRASGDQWINLISLFFYKLYKNNIKCICVFDGKDISEDKLEKRNERTLNIQNIEEKYKNVVILKELLINYYNDNKKTETPNNFKKKILLLFQKNKSEEWKNIDISDLKQCIKFIKVEEEKYRRQCIKITDEHFNIAKKIIKYYGYDIIQAPQEADKLCSYLCINGIVDAVLSEDTDILVYGTPKILLNYSIKNESVNCVYYNNILKQINFKNYMFTDFCIMCGCDYNNNIKGIGPSRSYKLISKYKTIEEISKFENINIEKLNHIKCRTIFNNFDEIYKKEYKIKIKDINGIELKKFLIYNKCRMSQIFWKDLDEYIIKQNFNDLDIKN